MCFHEAISPSSDKPLHFTAPRYGGAGGPGEGQNDHPAARASVVVGCLRQDGPGRLVHSGLVRRDPQRRSVLAWVDMGLEPHLAPVGFRAPTQSRELQTRVRDSQVGGGPGATHPGPEATDASNCVTVLDSRINVTEVKLVRRRDYILNYPINYPVHLSEVERRSQFMLAMEGL